MSAGSGSRGFLWTGALVLLLLVGASVLGSGGEFSSYLVREVETREALDELTFRAYNLLLEFNTWSMERALEHALSGDPIPAELLTEDFVSWALNSLNRSGLVGQVRARLTLHPYGGETCDRILMGQFSLPSRDQLYYNSVSISGFLDVLLRHPTGVTLHANYSLRTVCPFRYFAAMDVDREIVQSFEDFLDGWIPKAEAQRSLEELEKALEEAVGGVEVAELMGGEVRYQISVVNRRTTSEVRVSLRVEVVDESPYALLIAKTFGRNPSLLFSTSIQASYQGEFEEGSAKTEGTLQF